MSVIHKVLNELDKRENSTDHATYVPPAKNSSKTIVLAVVMGAMFIALVVVIALYIMHKQTLLAAPDVSTTPRPQVTPSVATPTPAPVVTQTPTEVTPANNEVVAKVTAPAVPASDPAVATSTTVATVPANEAVTQTEIKPSEPVKEAQPQTTQTASVASLAKPTPAEPKKEVAPVQNEPVADSEPEEEIANLDGNQDYYEEPVYEEPAPVVKPKILKVKKTKVSGKEDIELDRRRANNALATGNIQGAIEAYKILLSKAPTDTKAREKLASLYFGSNHYYEAIKVLNKGIELTPQHYDYRLYLARIYSSQNQKPLAIKVLSMANPPAIGNMDYYATMAALARDINDNVTAEKAYRKLSSTTTKDGKWLMGLGIVLEKQGKPQQALSAYRQASNLYLTVASQKFVHDRIQVLESK